MVGVYNTIDNGNHQKDHGFLLSGGAFTSIDFPGASATVVAELRTMQPACFSRRIASSPGRPK